MSYAAQPLPLLGGRLSVDFVNATPPNAELSWERLIHFLNSTDIVSPERGAQLLNLPQSDHQAAEGLLLRSEEHTSELQSLRHLVCRLLLEKKKSPWLILVHKPSGLGDSSLHPAAAAARRQRRRARQG